MTGSLSALARLTRDPARFADSVWGRRAEVAESRGPFDDLFTLRDADRVVAGSLRRPAIRMVRDGAVLGRTQYCTTTRLGGREVSDVADPRKVSDRIAEGATLVLQSLHRHWQPLTDFADSLMAEIGHAVQVNAYLTPGDAKGLATHAGEHDVFAVQIHGAKSWSVQGVGDVSLRPGDVLYVPAGCRHSATAQSAASLHLTIGVLRTTYRHVLERALRAATFDFLDEPLPLGYRHAGPASGHRNDLAAELARTIDAVAAELAQLETAELARVEAARTLRPFRRSGHLESIVGLHAVGIATTLEWVSAAPRFDELADSGGRAWVRVQLSDRSLRIPAAVQPAVEALAEARSLPVAELPGLDPASQVTVARRLVREGACVVSAQAQSSARWPSVAKP